MQYEHIFLPAKMFEGGKSSWIDLPMRRKLIDELYEEAYQQSVCIRIWRRISLLCLCRFPIRNVTRVDFPTRDMAQLRNPCLSLVWDDAVSEADILIDAKGDKTTELAEITEDYNVLDMELHRLRVLSFRQFLMRLKKVQRNKN